MLHNLSLTNSILNYFVSEIREVTVQKDPMRFRKNLERISEIIGYELSKTLSYQPTHIQTPLGTTTIYLPQDQVVIASILRAGLTMHTGLLNYFDRAENAFISAYREEKEDNTIQVHVEYKACPDLTDKTLIIADPMLATGKSMQLVYECLLQNGLPKKIIIVATIASQQAIDWLIKVMPENTNIWVAAVDPELNKKAYIVPGLGDAGDLAFGLKL
ncbi:MAG: uracil phosphoribosyltransferase [Crocinitomix sp.]|nr:uracil phosphoribosyltransferase [Crocinitomix sp.]